MVLDIQILACKIKLILLEFFSVERLDSEKPCGLHS